MLDDNDKRYKVSVVETHRSRDRRILSSMLAYGCTYMCLKFSFSPMYMLLLVKTKQ